jgi:hypothetical protein
MRWIVILLLLGNVAYWGIFLNERIQQQARQEKPVIAKVIDPSVPRLKLLQEADVLPDLRDESEQKNAEQTPEITVQKESRDEQAKNAEQQLLADTRPEPCNLYGPLPDAEVLKAAKEWMQQYDDRYGTYKTEKSREKQFWVYLEPLESQESVKARLEEFKKLGLKDYALIVRGDLKNAISLGVFRNQDSVSRRLAEMQEQGYTPVVVPHYKIDYQYWLYQYLELPEVGAETQSGMADNPLSTQPMQETDCRTIAKQLEAQ